jgi:ABC-type branched-subunit amino acid transport system substrate-binding protein
VNPGSERSSKDAQPLDIVFGIVAMGSSAAARTAYPASKAILWAMSATRQVVTTDDGTRRIAVTTPLDAYQPDQQSGIPASAV